VSSPSPEPPTERAVVAGGNAARRPTGTQTAAIKSKEIDAEVEKARIAANAANAARDDRRALVREVFAGLTSLSHSCAAYLPSWRVVAIVGFVVIALAAIVYNRQVALNLIGLGEVTTGESTKAAFDPHAMFDTDADGGAVEPPEAP
jgi:hypothetical protein